MKKEGGQPTVYIMADRFLKEDKVLFLGYYKTSNYTWNKTHFQMCLPEFFYHVGYHSNLPLYDPVEHSLMLTPVDITDPRQLGNFQKMGVGEGREIKTIGGDTFSFLPYLQEDMLRAKFRTDWTCVGHLTPSNDLFSWGDDVGVLLCLSNDSDRSQFVFFFAKAGFDSEVIASSVATSDEGDSTPLPSPRSLSSPRTLSSLGISLRRLMSRRSRPPKEEGHQTV